MNSREKGKRGERALAKALRDHGFDCRRGQQYCGANGDADVVGLDGVHIECKNVERLNIWNAYAQSVHDAKEDETPVVMFKKNHSQWLVVQSLDDWIELYRAKYFNS